MSGLAGDRRLDEARGGRGWGGVLASPGNEPFWHLVRGGGAPKAGGGGWGGIVSLGPEFFPVVFP